MGLELKYATKYHIELANNVIVVNNFIRNFLIKLYDNIPEGFMSYNNYTIEFADEILVDRDALRKFMNSIPNNNDIFVDSCTNKDAKRWLRDAIENSDPNNEFIYFTIV